MSGTDHYLSNRTTKYLDRRDTFTVTADCSCGIVFTGEGPDETEAEIDMTAAYNDHVRSYTQK